MVRRASYLNRLGGRKLDVNHQTNIRLQGHPELERKHFSTDPFRRAIQSMASEIDVETERDAKKQ